jgi:hypothetical protein
MITSEEKEILKGNDFGFSFDEEATNTPNHANGEKMEKIMTLVNDFLDKLAANPESKVLKWPDRGQRVRDFKNTINTIYLDNSAE